ncbi:hypothetical protein C8A05DRAFT_12579 [Staphylotrichum tortipilum]|uniref:F-box domain-containing protein n=1 Tax=Staphylotrichum tortipilum TaxID=2831512 RepID=A0AAN6MR91_9PEZI|nr:hypothetical protein C8A05DRAFT_12579 [Staphylotrichum longicolle]
MARLSNEIIAHIISHLAAESSSRGGGSSTPAHDTQAPALTLALYATVSRAWQQHVEAVTFAHIALTPARLASPLAAQALAPDRVRHFVRSVHVDVVLPPYGEEARARHEDEADRAANDAVFTDVVRRLFALLAAPHTGIVDAGYRPKIRLSMMARCVSDQEDIEAKSFQWQVSGGSYPAIFEARYESSYLDLRPVAGKTAQDEAKALPELYCIQEFHVSYILGRRRLYYTPRTFAPWALCLIASRMPGLERIRWDLRDNEKRDVALRKRLRADFAHTLQILPSSLQHFYLRYTRHIPYDHSFQTPSILDKTDNNNNNNDKLSLALHELSQRLASFNVTADVGPEVLWPLERAEDGDGGGDPLWPRMRDYSISPGSIAPPGQWRFRRSDSESDHESDGVSIESDPGRAPGDETDDPFRSELDPEAAHVLLLALARAVRSMPALWRMTFVLGPAVSCGNHIKLLYMVKGGSAARAGDGCGGGGGTTELSIKSGSMFRPDEEVLRIWREATVENARAKSGLVVVLRDMEREVRLS